MEPLPKVHYDHDPEDGLFVTQRGQDAGVTLEQAREADAWRRRDNPQPADPDDLP